MWWAALYNEDEDEDDGDALDEDVHACGFSSASLRSSGRDLDGAKALSLQRNDLRDNKCKCK